MIARIVTLGLLLAALAGCSTPRGEMAAPVMEPALQLAPAVAATDACLPGDDGIGGTGCEAE